MKKNANIELDAKWWRKNAALTLSNKSFGTALANYQISKDKLDYDKMQSALMAVEKERIVCLRACNKTFHNETINALNQYKKLIKKEQDKVTKDASAFRNKVVTPKQKVGKAIVIWSKDIGPEVYKGVKEDWIKGLKCNLSLKLDENILNVLEDEGDYVTPAFMVEDAQDIAKETTVAIVAGLRKYAKDSIGKPQKQRDKMAVAAYAALMTKVKTAEIKLSDVPMARWKKFTARKAQYKAYKLNCRADVILSSVTILTTATGITLTGGIGGVVGAIELVRSSAALAQQAYDLYIDAETAGKNFKSKIATLEKQYTTDLGKAKKKVQGSKEFSGTTMKMILGTDVPFLATIPKCKADLDLWNNKVSGVASKLPKLSKSLMGAIAATEKLEKDLKKNEGKEARKIYDAVVSSRKTLSKAFDKCADTAGKVRDFDRNSPSLMSRLTKLEAANDWRLDTYEKYGPATINLLMSGLSAASVGTGASSGNEGLKKTLETINTIEATLGTVLSEVKKLVVPSVM
jgi:hypothetical protein